MYIYMHLPYIYKTILTWIPLYRAYTLYTGIYTIYMTILTCTPVYMAYTLSIYRYIHHIHDDTDIYPCVYGIYT